MAPASVAQQPLPVYSGYSWLWPQVPQYAGLPQAYTNEVYAALQANEYILNHGTTAITVINPDVMTMTGAYNESQVALARNIMGFRNLQEAGLSGTVLNRPDTTNIVRNGGALWVGMEGLQGEAVGTGLWMSLRKALGFQRYWQGWDPAEVPARMETANATIARLEPSVVAQTASASEVVQYNNAYYMLQRCNYSLAIATLPEEDQWLIQAAMRTPISIQFQRPLSAVTNPNGYASMGVGTRLITGNIPTSDAISFIYPADMHPKLVQWLQRLMPNATPIPVEPYTAEAAASSTSIWSQMPQSWYNVAWQVGSFGNKVVEYLPAIGFVAFLVTPDFVIAMDALESQVYYNQQLSGRSNFTVEEWIEYASDPYGAVLAVGDPSTGVSMYQPWFDLMNITSDEMVWNPWNRIDPQMIIGNSITITPVIKAGTIVENLMPQTQWQLAPDLMVGNDTTMDPFTVTFDSWEGPGTKPTVTLSWNNGQEQVSQQVQLGMPSLDPTAPSDGVSYFGWICMDPPQGQGYDGGVINETFAIRYIANNGISPLLSIYIRPVLWVDTVCRNP